MKIPANRPLCTFRIVNDLIEIEERKLDREALSEFLERNGMGGGEVTIQLSEIQWVAVLYTEPPQKDEGRKFKLLAAAGLIGSGVIVEFRVCVHKDYRSQGLGRVMTARATELAIRYRKKVIMAQSNLDNKAWAHIANRDGFDPVAEATIDLPGLMQWRKEMR